MCDDFDIHNPTLDSLKNLIKKTINLAYENLGREVVQSLGAVEDKTAKIYGEYVGHLANHMSVIRDNMLPQKFSDEFVDASVIDVKYFKDELGEPGKWVTEYFIKVKVRDDV